MKKIYENWRRFRAEEETNNFPFQVYCDLDGVLVDFEKGATDTINADLQNPERVVALGGKHLKRFNKMVRALEELGRELRITPEDFSKNAELRISAVRNYMYPRFQDDYKFWAGLEWMPDGRELWDYIKNFDPLPNILTAPMREDTEGGDHRGKRMWVQEELRIDAYDDRVIVEADKAKYAIADTGAQNVLIDDTLKKINSWEEKGGLAILHTSTAGTIGKLEEMKTESDIPEEPLG